MNKKRRKLELDKTTIKALTSLTDVRGGYPRETAASCTTGDSYCYCFSVLGVTC